MPPRAAESRKGPLLREVAYGELKKRILNGFLRPGTPIPEQALCDSLGLSRTPVREAMNKLASENLIETIPRRGAFVVDLSIKEIKDVFEMRAKLDCMAVRLAIGKIREHDLNGYEAIFRKLIDEHNENGTEDLTEIDRAFHEVILEAAGNRWLKELVCLMLDRSQLIRSISLKYPGRMEGSWMEHLNLIAKLRENDIDGAEACALEHVNNAKNAVIKAIL